MREMPVMSETLNCLLHNVQCAVCSVRFAVCLDALRVSATCSWLLGRRTAQHASCANIFGCNGAFPAVGSLYSPLCLHAPSANIVHPAAPNSGRRRNYTC